MVMRLRSACIWWAILRHIGLYLFMVVWAVCGLAYTDIYPDNSVVFWQVTTVVFAVIAIVRVYHEGGPGRHVLALKQVAHWGAFLVAMVLLHIHFVTDLVSGDLLGIAMMTLLALATFLDGVYVDWRFCICLLYTSPSPRDGLLSRMPSSA